MSITEACERLSERNHNWLKGYCDGIGVPFRRVGTGQFMTDAGYRKLETHYRRLKRAKASAAA